MGRYRRDPPPAPRVLPMGRKPGNVCRRAVSWRTEDGETTPKAGGRSRTTGRKDMAYQEYLLAVTTLLLVSEP